LNISFFKVEDGSSSEPQTVVESPAKTAPLPARSGPFFLSSKPSFRDNMDRPAEMLTSTLDPALLKRFRFNSLLQFKQHIRPARDVAGVIAAWEPVMAEAHRLLAAAKEALDNIGTTHPYLPATSYPTMQAWQAALNNNARVRQQLHNQASSQDLHILKLQDKYSYELAYTIWWYKVEAYNAERKIVRDAYTAALAAHLAGAPFPHRAPLTYNVPDQAF
jgi:hypothetical protein